MSDDPASFSPFRTLRRSTSASVSSISSSSSLSYPYPRTHSTVMVLPSVGARPITAADSDSPTSSAPSSAGIFSPDVGYGRPRPPLNRAIPPIPESKSNESIMSQASTMANRHSAPPAPSETTPASTGHPSDPKPSTSSAPEAPDSSVVIANEMATNLGTKKAVRIVVRERDTKLPIALHKS
ncbi:Protein F28E10.1 d [Aphelenchoides avenae]|nr:Protein F28E10.1 d [Aphelenchus avenae]